MAFSDGVKKSPSLGIYFAVTISFPKRELHDAFLEGGGPAGAQAKAAAFIDMSGQVRLKGGVDSEGLSQPQELRACRMTQLKGREGWGHSCITSQG